MKHKNTIYCPALEQWGGSREKNLNQNRTKYRFHCAWILNRCVILKSKMKGIKSGKKNKTKPNCQKAETENSVCRVCSSCQLSIFNYLFHLFTLSVFVLFVPFEQTEIYISNLFFFFLWACSIVIGTTSILITNGMKRTKKENKNATQSSRGGLNGLQCVWAEWTTLQNTKHIFTWFILMIIN